MKYSVTYSCGHSGTVELYGKEADRQLILEWYASRGVCPDCYKAQQESERKAAVEGLNLPELEGSEKQIAWAEKIRAAFVASEKKLVDKYANATAEQQEQAKQSLAADTDPYSNVVYKKVIAVFDEKSAKWWIENRD